MPKSSKPERFVLITNLQYVSIGPVRTHCYALLLSEGVHFFDETKRRCQMRGFLTDPALETFDMDIPSIEFTSDAAASGHVFVGGDGEVRPLFSGGIFKIAADGPTVSLVKDDDRADFDIQRFEGPRDESPILRVWAVLQPKVRQYWRAPFMLVPQQIRTGR